MMIERGLTMADDCLWADDVVSGVDLSAVDLVSLDVFDTLLVRCVEDPVLVFDRVGDAAVARGLVDPALAGAAFRRLRQAGERAARAAAQARTGRAEVSLAEIYAAMGPLISDPAAVAALECAQEMACCEGNPALRAWLRHLRTQGKPVVLLSDMYLPVAVIADLLDRAGIAPDLYGALYVSGEYGCSKRDGGLFARLLEDRPAVPPHRVLHIGDDPGGDFAAARRAGLEALLYQPSFRYAAARERERRLAGGDLAAAQTAYHPARRLSALRRQDGDAGFWHDYGALILGPAVVEYVLWVVEDCHRRGLDAIACFWREGAVFAPLMRDYARRCGWPLRVEALAVSRQALAPLALGGLDGARARVLLQQRPHLPWNHLLREAWGTAADGAVDEPLPPPLRDAVDHLGGLTLDGLITRDAEGDGGGLARALSCFDHPDVRRRADGTVAALQRNLADYAGSRLRGRTALVDLGARGTTAATLVAALDQAGLAVDGLHAYLCYSVDDLSAHQLRGLPVSVYAGGSGPGMALGRALYRSPQAHERVLTGLEGTTLGYERGMDGVVRPRLALPAAQGTEADAIRAARDGVMSYWRLRLALGGDRGPLGAASAVAALTPLYACLVLPTPEEAGHLGDLQYDQNDGSDHVRRICDEESLATVDALLSQGAAPLLPLALGLRPAAVPWPQGALTRLDPTSLTRHHDAIAVDAGHDAVCRGFIQRLLAQGIDHVVLLAVGGEGGMGPAFLRAAAQQGLAIAAYADLMPDLLPADHFHGAPVVALEALPATGCRHVALATLGYRDQARARLARIYEGAGVEPIFLSLRP